jgi:uncharacterized SAM-binding protein YcdF (DUF218 family)
MANPLQVASSATNLIVLLGHENDENGDLSSIALERCAVALESAAADRSARILTTGAFGEHFNRSSRPHSQILRDHLVSSGLKGEQISTAEFGSRTLEDALVTRIKAVDGGFKSIVVITSDYHLDRVQLIFGRVLPDFHVSYRTATSNASIRERKDERDRLRRQSREWMEFPLYGISPPARVFPIEIYENAAGDQKTYDQISYAVVASEIAIAAFTLNAFSGQSTLLAAAITAGSTVLVGLLFVLYLRLARWANAGRRLMYIIEAQWQRPGFSYNALHGLPAIQPPRPLNWLVNIGFYKTVSLITVGLIAVQIAVTVDILRELRAPTLQAGCIISGASMSSGGRISC